MITENEYKVARRIVAVSWAMLVLAIGLLVWVLVDYFTGDAKAHNFASVIINIALFTTLIVHNRKKIKQYKSETNRHDDATKRVSVQHWLLCCTD